MNADATEKLNGLFKQAAIDGILPHTVEELFSDTDHWQNQVRHLSGYVGKQVAGYENQSRAKRFRNTGNKHR